MLLGNDVLRRLCRARELLEEIQEQRLSIQDVAREVRISPFHFIRQFEALFGATPHQFRIQSRLDRARLLLATGRHSVTEVCMEVGFASLGSFSDLFARRIGAHLLPTNGAHASWFRCRASSRQLCFRGASASWRACRRLHFRNFREAPAPVLSYNARCSRRGIDENQADHHHGR